MALERYLRFGDQRSRGPRGARSLLWPVHVWKTFQPRRRPQPNLFQEAILGLARAGLRNVEEMAALLGLDRDLVAFVIRAQLIPKGWLDSSLAVTARGEELLDGAEDIRSDVILVYAYQDAISGDWLPRFTESLSEIEAEDGKAQGYPVFRLGRDSGYTDSPFLLRGRREASADLAGLLRAWSRSSRDRRGSFGSSEEDARGASATAEHAFSFAAGESEPMWIWTWALPDPSRVHRLLIADPFDRQSTVDWLRKPLLDEVLPENPGLEKYLRTIPGFAPAGASADQTRQGVREEVDWRIFEEYGWARREPLLAEHLGAVLRGLAMAGREANPPREDLENLLIQSQKLAESLMQWMLGAYPPQARRLPDGRIKREWTREEAEAALSKLGLGRLSKSEIDRLATQKLPAVRAAVRNGEASLKAQIFAGLIAAADHDEHPFFKRASGSLELDRLFDLADLRNKAAHASALRISKQDALNHGEFVLAWVARFKEDIEHG
ncbi:hypothetical protein [Neomegalonema perideroedes]|uniref:hypothetical protein n=1 Tax=Neomegalonema perideroedes TaxID=217219 RepID=UPI000373D7F8|nr:hypothetical protein [Neomegalonema perideroedes]